MNTFSKLFRQVTETGNRVEEHTPTEPLPPIESALALLRNGESVKIFKDGQWLSAEFVLITADNQTAGVRFSGQKDLNFIAITDLLRWQKEAPQE